MTSLSDTLRLLLREPLTCNPVEWVDVSSVFGTPMWQSRRVPAAFSTDHGRSFTLEDEPEQRVHYTRLPQQWLDRLQARHQLSREQASALVELYLLAGPMTREDVAAMDRLAWPRRWEFMSRRWPAGAVLVAVLLYRPPDDDDPVPAVDPGRVRPLAA